MPAMAIWPRLRAEPSKLRAAITRENRRQLAAVVRRLGLALDKLAPGGGDGGADGAQYERLAKVAPRYNVHPKTLGRWLARDMPDALLKRKRLTLVDKRLLGEWETRAGRVRRIVGAAVLWLVSAGLC